MPMLGVEGNSLYYTVKDEELPIVFIHPPVLTCMNFECQIEELFQKFKMIAFDI